MSKRVKQGTLERYGKSIATAGSLTALFFISYLLSLGVITVGSYEANTVCGGDVVCYLEMRDVCFNEDVFLYPMDSIAMINAQPSDSVDSVKMYRGWGSGWREIPFDKGCTGSWCGKLKSDKRDQAVYSYAFREDKCYDIKYEIYKSHESTISWNINPSGKWQATYQWNGTNTTFWNQTGWNTTQHNKTTQHTNVTTWSVKNCKECKYNCTENMTGPTPGYWCTRTQYYNTTRYWNTTVPVYGNVTVMYPWNRTGIKFHIEPPNKDIYVPCITNTCDINGNYFVTKGPWERGASWYDPNLGECNNPGIPCEEFDYTKPGLGKFFQLDKKNGDADNVGVDVKCDSHGKCKTKTNTNSKFKLSSEAISR